MMSKKNKCEQLIAYRDPLVMTFTLTDPHMHVLFMLKTPAK